MFCVSAVTKQPEHKMADQGKPRSASHKISDAQVKQLKTALKESANKYDELLEHISEFQREEDRSRKGEIESVINKELKSTHELCLKLQREIETIEHKQRSAQKSADGASKKNVSAFAADFRLTPEEQDIAYEFRAHTMRKIHDQNQNIKKELELHEKKVDLKKCQQTFLKQTEDQRMSMTTLNNLRKMFEKRALSAEEKARFLREQLREADVIIQRYDELYHRQGGDPAKMRMKSPGSGKALRPDDIMRKNELLAQDNKYLKEDIGRLKVDNAELLKMAKKAEAQRDEAAHNLGTCDMSRQELLKRFQKEQKAHKALKASITNQTSNWIQEKKSMRLMDERERSDQVNPASPTPEAAQQRLYQIPVKKNVDKPRQTLLPVR